ncbi:MAG: DUF1801 domain-containing protein [Lentimicrobium sp.]|nr:DUF1801 domain-containing protein [Lentimicrobium sp.]
MSFIKWNQVTKYILKAPKVQKKLMEEIRALIHGEVPEVVENFKWSRPVFSTGKDFAYFKTTKAYLTFGFFESDKIRDNSHLLEGTGKEMRHIKLRKTTDFQPDIIINWIQQITA